MSNQVVFAIDIGGKSIKTGAVNESGLVQTYTPYPLPLTMESDTFFTTLKTKIEHDLSALRHEGYIPSAIGIGIPGIVDGTTGIAYRATNLPWPQTNFKELLESWTGLPTFVEHDVRSGAIAEAQVGALQGYDDYLYIAIGTGLGAAVCICGHIYTGSGGYGGELGHTIVIPNGRICACGRAGCLEAYCSAKHIERHYQERAGVYLTCKEIADLALEGNEIARRVWDDAAYALAMALVNYQTLLEPAAIVIGGGVAAAGEALLLNPIRDKIGQIAPNMRMPNIAFSELKQHSPLIGAGYQAMVRQRSEIS